MAEIPQAYQFTGHACMLVFAESQQTDQKLTSSSRMSSTRCFFSLRLKLIGSCSSALVVSASRAYSTTATVGHRADKCMLSVPDVRQ